MATKVVVEREDRTLRLYRGRFTLSRPPTIRLSRADGVHLRLLLRIFAFRSDGSRIREDDGKERRAVRSLRRFARDNRNLSVSLQYGVFDLLQLFESMDFSRGVKDVIHVDALLLHPLVQRFAVLDNEQR